MTVKQEFGEKYITPTMICNHLYQIIKRNILATKRFKKNKFTNKCDFM